MVVICGFKCESNHIAVMKMKSVAASAAPKPAFAEKESPGRMEFICVSDLLTAPLHDPQYDVWQMPPQNPSGMDCWPTTYIVELAISAFVAPPGVGMLHEFTLPAVAQFVLSAAFVGNGPEASPGRKITGPTGINETDAAFPPHSLPQFRI